MKTDGLGKTMFFPAMQLFTVPPCNLKYLHLPDINIKHPGRGATPLLVMARAVDHVSVWWEWKQMKGWEATLAMAKKFTHASCL